MTAAVDHRIFEKAVLATDGHWLISSAVPKTGWLVSEPMSGFLRREENSDQPLTHPTGDQFRVVSLFSKKEKAKVRLRRLRHLQYDHDGEGAAAAQIASVDRAIAFLDQMSTEHPYFVTIDDFGRAVLELESTNFFGDIAFNTDGSLECCVLRPIVEAVEGSSASQEVKSFLAERLGVFL